MTSKSLQDEFPLHWHAWHNEYRELDEAIVSKKGDIESVDPRGRTPLHLAVTLGHLESSKVLLRHGANANAENKDTWTVVQEAVCTGDPEMVQLVLQHRDMQRYTQRTEGVPGLLKKLTEAPDFYVEMKWEFASWVPLVSRMCPRDTYKVWKSGANVRIDTTLLGFDNMNWQRGKRSYVFKGDVDSATVMEIDHDVQHVYTETMRVLPDPADVAMLMPSQEAIAAKLTSPVITTFIDTDNIAFERNKSGLWGWRSDKVENVNDYQCKVFNASNVQLITRTRTEHMTEKDKEKMKKQAKTPLDSFLGIAEQHEKEQCAKTNGHVSNISHNPCSIEPNDYFNENMNLEGKDIGRPKDQSTKVQKFKATLWLAEEFPLSLPEQVVPIIDLMASSNAHFRKLKDFITLQLPAGFPVKIEIPLFHVLNARITFGNIFASENPAEFVSCIRSGGSSETDPLCCVVEDRCFDVPTTYSVTGEGHRDRVRDEDEELLQFAIQQSLVAAGTEDEQVTFYEALNRGRPLPVPPVTQNMHAATRNMLADEDRQLQRALEASMMSCQLPATHPPPASIDNEIPVPPPTESSPPPTPAPDDRQSDADEQLMAVMEMSRRQQEEDEKRRKQEEEELEEILKLSLTEK